VRVVELGQPGGAGRNGNGRGVMPANPTAVAGAAPANGSPEGPVAAAAPAPAPVAPAAPVRAASPILAAPSLGGANPCAVSLADSRSPRPRNP
jgi:2-oxoglutarate dehydrogenase E2 component (dihydrolipoamide succinyltransferase)